MPDGCPDNTDRLIYETLNAVAAEVGTAVSWLCHLIDFESRWDPQARNPISGARGLIQFMPKTARDLGYESADDLVARNPDIVSQLQGPVLRYLKQYAPLESDQELFMAVFYPVARDWPLDKQFPQDVQDDNPGIRTVRDYMNKVYRRPDPWKAVFAVLAVALLLSITLIRR